MVGKVQVTSTPFYDPNQKYGAVVSFSGGMDSATLLMYAARLFTPKGILAVGFTYGSKHNVHEARAASEFAERLGVSHRVIDLSAAFALTKSDLLKSGGVVPEGHYEEESMRATVVPGRNLIFASILAGIAESVGAGQVLLGVHAGDHHIYPDCRADFIAALRQSVHLSSGGKIRVEAPWQTKDKAGILVAGYRMDAAFPYRLTRTCYKDQEIACGKCGSCQERLEAFQIIGKEDPLEYESREILPKKAA